MDYKAKKIKNQVLQEFIKNKVSKKNFERIQNCGSFLLFHTCDRKGEEKIGTCK